MFIGHYGVAFAAKKAAPKVSLGWLVAATSFIDLLWSPFLLLGVEHVRIVPGYTAVSPFDLYDFPWSHSLLMTSAYAAILGGLFFALKKDGRGALVIAGLTVSHWLLDLVVHVPDLPVTPWGSARFGLGLWNSLPGTLIVEFGLFGAGLWLYFSERRFASPARRYGMIAFTLFLAVAFLGSVSGAPPPSVEALGYFGIMPVMFVPLSAWLDAKSAAVH